MAPQSCSWLTMVILTIFAGILYNLAMPGGPWPIVAWIALVPFFYGVQSGKFSAKQAFWGGNIVGGLLWIGSTYWLYIYMLYVLEIPAVPGFALMTAHVLWGALAYGLAAWFMVRFGFNRPTYSSSFVFAALLTCTIVFSFHPFRGHIAYSFYKSPYYLQLADIGGAPLVLFLILLINAFFAQGCVLIFSRIQHGYRPCLVGVACFTFLTLYGWWAYGKYEKINEAAPYKERLRIGVVQPNVPGKDLSNVYGPYLPETDRYNNYKSTLSLTAELIERSQALDCVFWPELPLDFPIHEVDYVYKDFMQLVDQGSMPIFFISTYPYPIGKPYLCGQNALYCVHPGGEITHPYAKAHLIPFSEFLPWEKEFPKLRRWFPYTAQMTAGDKMDPISLSKKKACLVPLICYDGLFDHFVRRFVQNSGNCLISLDNNANFGPTRAADMQLAALIYRVVENRVPLVRVNNSGPSVVVLSSGSLLKGGQTERYEKTALELVIPLGTGKKTPYQNWGYTSPFWFLFFLGTVFFVKVKKRSLHNS